MRPWVASVPQLSGGPINRRAIDRLPRCARLCNVAAVPKFSKLRPRYLSAHVSPTAINARPNVPPSHEELYNALSVLSKDAEAYVNISRLQLALRGVGAHEPVMRLAILSLGSQINAQKLARLILADPLAEAGTWEQQLETVDVDDGKAVLLRYGDETDAVPPSPLFKILPVPSRILRQYNLEVLVSTLNVDVSNTPMGVVVDSPQDAILDPKLRATSAAGRPVPYPVHRSLLVGQGLDSAVAFGRFTSDEFSDMGDMVKVAVDLPSPAKEPASDPPGAFTMVNIESGTKALDSFRESIAHSKEFERGWFRSGLPALTHWLAQGLHPSEHMKPALRSLVLSVADDAEANVTKEDVLQLQKLNESAVHQKLSAAMLKNLEGWAEHSHTELRDQIDAAVVARNWNKLVWWKLFWRVDDVTMITSEIIQQKWLVDAEKRAVYLAGQMDQAGFPTIVEHVQQVVVADPNAQTPPAEEEAALSERLLDVDQTAVSTEVRTPLPWHTQISTHRSALVSESIPPLQALAQRLVLQTLSTTSLTSALSALVYVSMQVSMFEASAIAALGLVWSLRRMQKLWESARESWQLGVREEGRKTLKTTEDMVKYIVSNTKKTIELEGVEERKKAREAVERVRDALERV